MRKRLFLALSFCLVSACAFGADNAAAGPTTARACPQPASKAIAQTREELARGSGPVDRKSVACLVEAVGEINQQLESLIEGRISFEGTVRAPAFAYIAADKPK